MVLLSILYQGFRETAFTFTPQANLIHQLKVFSRGRVSKSPEASL
jgi:hypothetical protein